MERNTAAPIERGSSGSSGAATMAALCRAAVAARWQATPLPKQLDLCGGCEGRSLSAMYACVAAVCIEPAWCSNAHAAAQACAAVITGMKIAMSKAATRRWTCPRIR